MAKGIQQHDPPSAISEPPFIPFASTWALPNGFGAGDMDLSPAIPTEFGSHRVSFQSLGNGCGVFDATVQFNRQVQITGTVVSESPFLLLRIPLAGRVRVGLHGDKTLTETPDASSFFLHGRVGDQCSIEQHPGECSDLVAPMIAVDRLRLMLEGMRTPAVIEKFLDGHGDNFIAAPRMSAALRHLGFQFRGCPYSGDLGSLYRQGKLFEVLASVLGDLDDRSPRRGPTLGVEQAKVAAICDRLVADLANPPSQEALAREFGLSQRRLSDVFRDVTGMTLMEWVLRRKLALAADLLREGSLSIKEIAYRIGYAQVSTFTTAFNRRYGCPPAGFRKSQALSHFIGFGSQ